MHKWARIIIIGMQLIRQDCSVGTLYIFGQFDSPKILLFKITE